MDVDNFLRSVLPLNGRYCVVGMDGGTSKYRNPTHHFVETVEQVREEVSRLLNSNKDVYFTMASFDDAGRRKAEHALYLRSFFLDLDCGEGKPYAGREDALQALDLLCACLQVPRPTLVSSGYGVHAYWALTDEVDAELWRVVARKFKAACQHFAIDFDHAVPADVVRVLRVPGTKNLKNLDDIRDVTLMSTGEPVTFAQFSAALDAVDMPEVPQHTPKPSADIPVSELTKALMGNRTASFSVIARKSLGGSGCNAIKYILVNQEEVEEPLWYSGLSIAWHCEDKDTAIHKMSSKYPGYDYDETIRKASGAQHPHNCSTFKEKAPHLCADCKLDIANPIVLGHKILRAEPVEQELDAEEVVCEKELTAENIDDELAQPLQVKVAYTPPFPYFRGKNGGVYKQDYDIEGNTVEGLVYEHDFWATQRLNDPNDGEVVVFKLVLPQDGEREFYVPLADIHAADKFKAIVGRNGVAANQKQMKDIMDYAIKYAKELQLKARARQARLQFGWSENKDGLVVGNRVYTANKVLHNPASSATSGLIHWLEPVGSLTTWRSIINALAVPGLEPLQFAALCGFGSPLMPFSGLSGVTVNLLSNESGTGKSTATQIALSVFGHPTHTMLIERDTPKSKEHKLGILNNLCAGADEMTNVNPVDVSNLIYAVSQGRGNDRMDGQTNRLRANHTHWQLIMVTNSNASMVSKLSKNKARPDGELMRLLELHVKRVVIPYGDQIFAQLYENYGVAGPVFAQWVVKNKDSLQKLIDTQRDRLWSSMGKRIEERFIIGTASVVLVAGRIAQKLGLHDLDMDNLERWFVAEYLNTREQLSEEVSDAEGILGEFLNQNTNAVIGVNKDVVDPFTRSPVFHQPRGQRVVARFELVDGVGYLFLSKKDFRDYCVDRQYTMSDALESFTSEDAAFKYLGVKKKRLMSDTGVLVPSVDALVFECSSDEADAMRRALEMGAEYGEAPLEP